MKKRILSTAAAAVCLVVTTGVGAANAATAANIADKHKDAAARLDVTRARVVLTAKRLTATIHVRDLRKYGAFSLVYYQPTEDWDTYNEHLTIWRYGKKVRSHAVVVNSLMAEASGAHYYGAGCKVAAKWNAKKNFVRVSVARKCAGSGIAKGHPVYAQVLTSATQKHLDHEVHLADRTATKKLH